MKRIRDAESEFPSSVIKEIVEEIRQSKLSVIQKKAYFEKKYSEFFENFPTLSDACCSPDFDYGRFKYMMTMRDNVLQEKVTLDGASKEIGQKLFDHYVKPHINE
jgi:hypothetical protein